MPELPEVETIRRQLSPRLVGSTITDAWAFDSPKFADAPLAVGATVSAVARRGKYLLIGLSPLDRRALPGWDAAEGTEAAPRTERSAELVVHLGMTGRLSLDAGAPDGAGAGTETGTAVHPHLRVRWSLDDGSDLSFHDIRRFGRVAVVRAGCYGHLPTLAALGPEPDDEAFDPERLRSAVNTGRRPVKTVLLSQRVVAGVGNIYADEALWRAGVDPRSRRLTRSMAARLRDTVREVIAEGIDHGGTTLRDYRDADGNRGSNQHRLDCYGRSGAPCHRCGATIARCVVDARTTAWCPRCQRR